jgi:hypothetical protein
LRSARAGALAVEVVAGLRVRAARDRVEEHDDRGLAALLARQLVDEPAADDREDQDVPAFGDLVGVALDQRLADLLHRRDDGRGIQLHVAEPVPEAREVLLDHARAGGAAVGPPDLEHGVAEHEPAVADGHLGVVVLYELSIHVRKHPDAPQCAVASETARSTDCSNRRTLGLPSCERLHSGVRVSTPLCPAMPPASVARRRTPLSFPRERSGITVRATRPDQRIGRSGSRSIDGGRPVSNSATSFPVAGAMLTPTCPCPVATATRG